MTNLEKYNNLFIKNLKVKEEDLGGLKYRGTNLWDSLGHTELISDLEELFDIHINTEDVMDIYSYERGKEVLKKYGVII